MKNGIKNTTLWITSIMATLFSCSISANESELDSQPKWKVEYSADGTTRFEVVHADKTHFYEIKLTGIDIDGEAIDLIEPEIKYHNNQVIKQWLPYLKETWIDAQGQLKWSFEINRPDFLSESAKQITLTYDIETDGEGGITVGDNTAILFDVDAMGDTIHQTAEIDSISVSLLGSRCLKAMDTAGYAGNYNTVVFDLNKKLFPLFTQGHIDTRTFRKGKIATRNPDWYLSKFSENNDIVQLVVPKEEIVNDKRLDTYDVFHLNIPNQTVVDSEQADKSQVLMKKVTENELFNFIKLKPYWIPVTADQQHKAEWENSVKADDKYWAKIQSAFTGFGNRSLGIAFSKTSVVSGKYLYLITDGYGVGQISILKYEGKQWIKKDPIVINYEDEEHNPLDVYKIIEEVIVSNDLMVVAMEAAGHVVPDKSDDNQSAGQVRVYRKINNEWQLEKILTPELGDSQDEFGGVVAVGENLVVVSAYEFDSKKPDSLNGVVHLFNFQAGKWQKPIVIKPPVNAKSDSFYHNQGFGNQIQLVGDDLYVKALSQGYSSNQVNQSNTSVDCPYFDSFGVIYHYRKVNGQWQLLYELKSTGTSSDLVGPMMANDTGLYFLSSDSVKNSEPEVYIKHYSEGKVDWQQQLSN